MVRINLKLRELRRLGYLMNTIYLLQAKYLQMLHTYKAEPLSTGTYVLFQGGVDGPLAQQNVSCATKSQQIKKMGYCFNGCVHALEPFAGVLALFAEDESFLCHPGF